jgi:hypothetical protein
VVAFFTLLSLVPWAMRNYAESGRLVPLSTSAGHTLLAGNYDGAAGGPLDASRLPAAFVGAAGDESDRDRVARGLVLRWITTHPADALGLEIGKLREMWTPRTALLVADPAGADLGQRWIPVLFWTGIMLTGWIGALLAPRRAGGSMLAIVFVHSLIVALIFFALDRYRLALATFWLAPAAWTLSGHLPAVVRGETRAALARRAAALIGILAFLAPKWMAVVGAPMLRHL